MSELIQGLSFCDQLISLSIMSSGSSFPVCVCVCVCVCARARASIVLSCVQLFAIPWTVARQAPLSMEFSKQEYWSGLPFPSPGDLPVPGIEPESLAFPALAGRFFPTACCSMCQNVLPFEG